MVVFKPFGFVVLAVIMLMLDITTSLPLLLIVNRWIEVQEDELCFVFHVFRLLFSKLLVLRDFVKATYCNLNNLLAGFQERAFIYIIQRCVF